MCKTCSCGARFQLHVELAVHRQETGHAAFQMPASFEEKPAAVVVAPRRQRRGGMLAVGLVLIGLMGLTAGLNVTVSSYTSWRSTANVLLMP